MKTSKNNFTLFVFFLILMQAAACRKKDDETNTLRGSISGTVQTWDDKLSTINDKQGITVSLLNTINVTTTTDADGKFRFEDMPYDTYNISFSKPGYGTFIVWGAAHPNSSSPQTIIPNVNFGINATTTVSNLTVTGNTFNGEPGVNFTHSFFPAPSTLNKSYFRYFFSTSPFVSSTNYSAYSSVRSASVNAGSGGFTNAELTAMGFTAGQTIYVHLYGESVISNDYTDPNTGKRIFPNINVNTVNPVSFIMQ
jgi:hypothetical protein